MKLLTIEVDNHHNFERILKFFFRFEAWPTDINFNYFQGMIAGFMFCNAISGDTFDFLSQHARCIYFSELQRS